MKRTLTWNTGIHPYDGQGEGMAVHDVLDLFGEVCRPAVDGILKQRFLLPPFSVLSARDGDWQARKRLWLSLGIKSELGRGDVLPGGGGGPETKTAWQRRGGVTTGGGSVVPDQDYFRSENKARGFRTAAAIPGGGGGVYGSGGEVGGFVADGESIATASGTSVFDPVLCELAYKWFCPPGGQVLDPFCGGSVRGIVASLMGRRYFGVDLSAPQVAANRAQLDIAAEPFPIWTEGDSRSITAHCGPQWPGADFVFSCPPYADLEVYSDDLRDLSAVPWPQFRAAYAAIIADCVALMRPDSFAVFVVGDARGKDGYYYGLPAATIAAFEAGGARLYNEAVLVTAVGSLPVRINQQFVAGRKLGKTHQNILMFCKGDARRAAARCEALVAADTGVSA